MTSGVKAAATPTAAPTTNATTAPTAAQATGTPMGPLADDGHGHSHDEQEDGGTSGSETEPGGNGTVAVSYKADVVPMLRTHCASCHVPGGGVPTHAYWFDAAGEPQYQAIKDHAGIMVRLIKSGEMPKGRPNAMPPELVEELDAWRTAGAPQN